MVAGLFVFADLRRRGAWVKLRHLAGFCFGLGGFQLYDGLIQHKWWHIHEIRYHVGLLPYDLVWNIIAGLVLILGVVLLRRAQHQPQGAIRTRATTAGAH